MEQLLHLHLHPVGGASSPVANGQHLNKCCN